MRHVQHVRLSLALATPAPVARFVRRVIEAQMLVEAHAILCLATQARRGSLLPFALAHVLLGIISGVSVTLCYPDRKVGEAFRLTLRNFYPFDLEHDQHRVARDEAADAIYEEYRCSLAHDAGLGLDDGDVRRNRPNAMRRVAPRGYKLKYKILRFKDASTVRVLADCTAFPPRQSATVVAKPGKKVLNLGTLYWGTRRMIERISADVGCMQRAHALLSTSVGPSMATNLPAQPELSALAGHISGLARPS